jgi:hypothetical protein
VTIVITLSVPLKGKEIPNKLGLYELLEKNSVSSTYLARLSGRRLTRILTDLVGMVWARVYCYFQENGLLLCETQQQNRCSFSRSHAMSIKGALEVWLQAFFASIEVDWSAS